METSIKVRKCFNPRDSYKGRDIGTHWFLSRDDGKENRNCGNHIWFLQEQRALFKHAQFRA